MTDTEKKIHSYILNEIMFGDDGSQLGLDENLLAQGVIDSMDLQRLVVFVEEEFDIVIGDDLLMPSNFQDLRSIAAMVDRVRSGAGAD
jgi:acyl carrier protein